AELVLIAHIAERIAAILSADAAAIPIVSSLKRAILQEIEVGIEADPCRRTPAGLVRTAISAQKTELIEAVRTRDGIGDKYLPWRPQKSVTSAEKELFKFVIHE